MATEPIIFLCPEALPVTTAPAPPRVFEWLADERDARPVCAFCDGGGDICNPGNADPSVKVTDWLYPQVCPRCGGSGKDPNPG